jgi:hypothetical protein
VHTNSENPFRQLEGDMREAKKKLMSYVLAAGNLEHFRYSLSEENQ